MIKNLYLFQPQFITNYKTERHVWLPYSAACIWTYAVQNQKIAKSYQLNDIYVVRDNPESICNELNNPAVCGFSVYVWNEQYCLTLAEKIKRRWPSCVIIFGGPQTGGRHLGYDFIDHIVYSEGETAFTDILEKYANGDKPQRIYKLPRLDVLNIPSPYLTGILDKVIEKYARTDYYFNAILETSRGCPYACTFCDWGGLTYSKVKKLEMEKIEQEINWFATHRVRSVMLADANFGIFKDRDCEIANMLLQNSHVCRPGSSLEYVNINYAKNSNENVFKLAKILQPVSNGLTLSAQSMSPEVLKIIKRDNMQSNDVRHILKLADIHELPTYTELILGLPGETAESFIHGVTELLEYGQHNWTHVYFAMLLENTEMNLQQKLLYKIRTVVVNDYFMGSVGDPIKECAEMVQSTNTMTIEDLVNCFMYAWSISQFHQTGFVQLLTKYARHVLNTTYKQLFNKFDQAIQNDVGLCGQEYRYVKALVSEFLRTGQLSNGHDVHTLSFVSIPKFYFNMQAVIELMTSVIILRRTR